MSKIRETDPFTDWEEELPEVADELEEYSREDMLHALENTEWYLKGAADEITSGNYRIITYREWCDEEWAIVETADEKAANRMRRFYNFEEAWKDFTRSTLGVEIMDKDYQVWYIEILASTAQG